MKNQIKKNRTLSWIDSRGFMQSNFHRDAFSNKLTIQEAEDYIDTLHQLCGGKPTPFLIDCRNVFDSMDEGVKQVLYENTKLNEIRKAEAFVVDSLSMRLKLNFYSRVHKPYCPIKIFSNESDAIAWLLSFNE